MSVKRLYHRYPRHHQIAAALSNQHQHLHRSLPFWGVVLPPGVSIWRSLGLC
jgi:hypothetical protein